ncbi:immunoglobulin-like domain-containing protein [Enterococcus sp. AZ029]|uniref:immunoglobulin-like domain-containing protein n=1 Tax=Enterococcus sp. AZ029 TaxID=2774841 RepID=UPI003F1FB21B
MTKEKKIIALLATTGILMNSTLLPIITIAEEIDKTNESKLEVTETVQETKESLLDSAEETNKEKDLSFFGEQNDKQQEAIEEMSKVTEKNVSDTSLFDFNVTLTETGKLRETIIEAIKWYDDNWYNLEAGYSRPDWGMQQNINITTTVPLNDADWETIREIPELTYFTWASTDLKNVDIIRLNSEGFDMDIPDNALNFDGGGVGNSQDPKIFNTWLRSFESNAKNIGSNFGAYTWALENVVLPNAEAISDNFLNFSFAKRSEYVSVNLPQVTTIGSYAFKNSNIGLTAQNLREIGDYAFWATKISEINMPLLETTGSYFFYQTFSPGIMYVSGSGLEPERYSINYVSNSHLNLNLPSLVNLGFGSFYLTRLNELTLPRIKEIIGLHTTYTKNIKLESVESIRDSFNSGGSSLDTKNINIKAPMLKRVEDSFSGSAQEGLTLIAPLLEEVGDNSFKHLGSGTDINGFNFPNLVRIGNNSFNNKQIDIMYGDGRTDIHSFIAPKLESVGDDFMRGVTTLEILEVPNLKSIGKDSFSSWYSPSVMGQPPLDYASPNLKQIEIGITKVSELQDFFEESKESLIDLTMNSVEKIVDNDGTLGSFKVLESLTMNEVKNVGDSVLKDFKNLNSVEMLKVEEFGDSAFEQALALKDVKLPNVKTFGQNAFDMRDNTSQLTQVTLPEVQKMGDNAFRGSATLSEVTLPKLQELGSFAFYMTRELKTIHLPSLTKIDTTNSFGGEGRTDALIFTKGNLSDETLNSIFNDKPEVLGVLTGGNTEQELFVGDALFLGEVNLINGTTALVERSFTWKKDGVSLDHSLAQYQKENVTLEDSGLYTSNILLNNNEYILNTHSVTVTEAPEIVTFETDDYHIGDYNITGRFSTPIVTAQLRINGEISNRGGTFNKIDGTFYYYAGAGRIQVNQEVVLEGLNEQGEIVKSIKIEPKVKEGSLDNVQYTLGNNTIVGEYSGEVRKARLVVNGNIISVGGTFDKGEFSYYVHPNQIKETDTIQIQGYDAEGNPIGNLAPVTLKKQEGNLIEANYKVGESEIIGKYEGNVKKARLIVDNKPVSWGGTFKNGVFSYYVAPGTINEDSRVELAAYGTGDYLLSEDNFAVDVKR